MLNQTNKFHKLEHWLNTKHNKKYNFIDYEKVIEEMTKSHSEFELYYTDNDTDVCASNILDTQTIFFSLIDITEPESEMETKLQLNKYLEYNYTLMPDVYKTMTIGLEIYIDDDNNKIPKKIVLIDPNTNRYYTNLLFKKIIQCILNNDMKIIVPNIKYIKNTNNTKDVQIVYMSRYLLVADDKIYFYKFCMKNTTKISNKYKLNTYTRKYITFSNNCENEKKISFINKPYPHIDINKCKELLTITNENIDKFNKYCLMIWNTVIKQYFDENADTFLDKLYCNYPEFLSYMKSGSMYCALNYSLNRLNLTKDSLNTE
jgi:hypothetical protein